MHNNRGRMGKKQSSWILAEKNTNFQHFEQVTNQNSDQKCEEETEDRISCSSDKHQVPRKSQILSLSCYFIIFYYIPP